MIRPDPDISALPPGLSEGMERFLAATQKPYVPPLDDNLLLQSNFFELYPLDGGGSMISRSIVPNLRDETYAREVLEGAALRDFGQLPRLEYRRFERWRTVEKSCWLNRFYWIVPLAKRCALANDPALARLIIDTLLYFIESCPPPANRDAVTQHMREVFHERDFVYNKSTFEELQCNESDIRYIWFDFQPASRLLHWMYVLYFLAREKSIRPDEWSKIIGSLYQHAQVIYYGERYGEHGKMVPGNNHQSLRGLALLYAGTFFKGFGQWREFLEWGVRIVEFHSREGFFPDGALKEISPAYHCFQTWHVRDAWLLSEKYGFPIDAGMEKRLQQQAAFLAAVTDPSGHSVALNDAYPVATGAFLQSLPSQELAKTGRGTVFFPDAGIVTVHRPDLFFLLDASVFTGAISHYHGGKNAITLWVADRPFLVDSGCCSYDDDLVAKWYRTARAHSTLLVDGMGDSNLISIYEFASHANVHCEGWKQTAGSGMETSSTLTSTVAAWQDVVWQRRAEIMAGPALQLTDRVTMNRAAQLTFIFNTHPDVVPSYEGNDIVLVNGSVRLRLSWQSETAAEVEMEEGRCYIGFAHRKTRRVLIHLGGSGTREIRFRLEKIK